MKNLSVAWWRSAALLLPAVTILTSGFVGYLENGHLLQTVQITRLRSYGGVTFEDLKALELWRLAMAQLLHAKMFHMLYNALCLGLLGVLLERAIGPWRLLFLWLFAGGIATAISPILVDAPWNVGTGASQATFAFAGCAGVLAARGAISGRWTVICVAVAVIPGSVLDLMSAGYLKPGHVLGGLLGMGYAACLWRRQSPQALASKGED
ncbi:rhomboid family intramembrane serine protease [uncultured Celeribacter sp.]|uniref:rhomboid family intramembrane serine protease n=1 Tax=uncultured Celeribacter sp. TaxID=1303376 RepID=UPI002AA7F204|nr:rhomboid family intramembrane serine protease [uncultured Celeribacter sp.]